MVEEEGVLSRSACRLGKQLRCLVCFADCPRVRSPASMKNPALLRRDLVEILRPYPNPIILFVLIKPIKEKSDTVVISKADYESANDAKAKRYSLEERAQEAERTKQEILKTDYRLKNFKLEVANAKLQEEQAAILSEKNNLQNKLANMNKVFDRNPKFWGEFLRLAAELERIEQAELRAIQLERQRQKQSQAELW